MKEILGNKLIAEFIGLNKEEVYKTAIVNGRHIKRRELVMCYLFNGEWFRPEDLLYKESWDWLMPVVEKVKSYLQEIKWETTVAKGEYFYVMSSTETSIEKLKSSLYSCDLNKTFKLVVKSIKGINKFKEKNGKK